MLFFKLSFLYFAYFALLGLLAPYLGLYLEYQGYSLMEIAQLLSLLLVTKVAAPLLWGSLADRNGNSVFLVRFGSFMTLFCYLGFFIADSFWSHALVIILFSFFWNAILPQIEVVTLFNLGVHKDLYGRVRLWGSVGFILSVAGFGYIFEVAGIQLLPIMLLIVIALLCVACLAHYRQPQKNLVASQNNQGFLHYFKRRDVWLFFLICFFLQVSHGAYYTYFSIYLESLGYQTSEVGALWSLGVLAEVILFIFMHRWFAVNSLRAIMLISLLLTAFRWFMTAEFAHLFWVVLLLQCLHAFSFGAMHASAIKFVHQVFSAAHQGRAQALYSSFGFGAGGALGAYASGLLVSSYHYAAAFIFSALTALLASALLFPLWSNTES